MQHLKTIFDLILPSAKWVYRILSASAETFLRHAFGSRYIGNLWLGFMSCCLYMAIMHFSVSGKEISDCYLVAYFCLAVYHTTSAFRRESVVHSQFTGKPWPFWNLELTQVKKFQLVVEPGLLFVAGLLITPMDSALAVWFFGCAICLFVKGLLTSHDQHSRLLDALDARLEGERMNNAVREHHAPRQQEQPSTVAVSQQPQRTGNVRDMASNLDPALQRLMTENNPTSSPRRYGGPLGHLPRITAQKRR